VAKAVLLNDFVKANTLQTTSLQLESTMELKIVTWKMKER
jgi:hypothetical protein